LNDNHSWQIKLPRKLQIAFVMRGHTTDRPCPVTGQHIISDPDWNLFIVCRINRVRSGEYAGLAFREVGAFEIAFARGPFAILAHRGPLLLGDN